MILYYVRRSIVQLVALSAGLAGLGVSKFWVPGYVAWLRALDGVELVLFGPITLFVAVAMLAIHTCLPTLIAAGVSSNAFCIEDLEELTTFGPKPPKPMSEEERKRILELKDLSTELKE